MKRILTLLLLFTLTAFLSGNQVVITQNYDFIVSEGAGYNFSSGNNLNDARYERTNKIAIVNNKVLADPLKYHYAFFWDEADNYLGYYKTNKGINTGGDYLGQVNNQSIPLPLNAYSFALVRYDNDYEIVAGLTIEDIFLDSDNYFSNSIDWTTLNNLTLNELFIDNNQIDLTDTTVVAGRVTPTFIGDNQIDFVVNGVNNDMFRFNNIIYTSGDVFYFNVEVKGNASGTFRLQFNATLSNTFQFGMTPDFTYNSNISTAPVTSTFFRTGNSGYIIGETFSIKNPHLLNLTSLGLTSLTKTNLDNYYELHRNVIGNNFTYSGYLTTFINPTYGYDEKLLNLTAIFGAGNEPDETTMDGFYAAYEEYLEYLYVCCTVFENQTISYEVYYFDDGVSSEIEQLGSILIFTLIGFTLMIFGFVSKRRIFNLLSIGAFVVLGVLLAEFTGFLVIVFGLVVLNLYYTFLGDL
jgi:hypothetical protein